MTEWREEHQRLREQKLVKDKSTDKYSKISYVLPVPEKKKIVFRSSICPLAF